MIKVNEKEKSAVSKALKLIEEKQASCVVIKNGAIIHTADGRGVSPLLKLYESEPEKLRGAVVVDKVIGKAAAMILTLGKSARVYGVVMSAAGREYLEKHGIVAEYSRRIDTISNSENSGICPIERSVMDIGDPEQGLTVIKETVMDISKC